MNFEKVQDEEPSSEVDETWQRVDKFLEKHKNGLLSHANYLVRGYHLNLEGDDLYLETAYRIHDHFSTFNNESEYFYGWAKKVMRNLAIDKSRKLKNKPTLLSLDDPTVLNQASQKEDIASYLEDQQLREKILDAIEDVSPRDKLVMILHLDGDLNTEIAQKLQISLRSVLRSLAFTKKIIETQFKAQESEINI